MAQVSEKVTAFITRQSESGCELLLFRHPHAGIQIPSGTVKEGESPAEAVLREAEEETGLALLSIVRSLGSTERKLAEGERIVTRATRVYARPDKTSFDWAYLRPGIMVTVNRRAQGFCQVAYEEPDQVPDAHYVSMAITGWVPEAVLGNTVKRHFFQLEHQGRTEASWTVRADNHAFHLFWAPLADLPEIIPPQDEWLRYLDRREGSR
jgi:8-oxo-dGTP pyrophosphatase MutT (NUDIX family)